MLSLTTRGVSTAQTRKGPVPRGSVDQGTVASTWCENTSCHGIVDLYHSSNICSRLFWFLLIIGAGTVALWQIHGLVYTYAKIPHYETNVYRKENELAKFPNVSICNFNRFNKTKAAELNMPAKAMELLFLQHLTTYEVSILQINAPDMSAWFQEFIPWWETVKGRFDMLELYRYLGHDCQSTLLSCYFNTIQFNCCNYAVPVVNTEYGLCWVITPPIQQGHTHPKQIFPSVTHGLKLHVNPNLEEYVTDAFYNNFMEEGIIIAPTYNPYNYWYTDQFPVGPGKRARLQIDNQFFTFQKPQFQIFTPDCSLDAKLMHAKGNFTLENCYADCMQEIAVSSCQCYFFGEVNNNELQTCTPMEFIKCASDKLQASMLQLQVNETLSTDPFVNCIKTCNAPCNDYDEPVMESSSIDFPATKYVSRMAEHLSNIIENLNATEKMVEQMIVVDVYFTKLGYTIIERNVKTAIFTLIGNVGGQLGLWMGVSILTIVQAVYYAIYCILSCNGRQVKPD